MPAQTINFQCIDIKIEKEQQSNMGLCIVRSTSKISRLIVSRGQQFIAVKNYMYLIDKLLKQVLRIHNNFSKRISS